MDSRIGRHVFSFNPKENSGEQFTLTTDILKTKEGSFYTNHEITLQSYGNQSTFKLVCEITPETLRKLADELEQKLRSLDS